jgi:uncharacterized damage-inducible protein DinB
MKKSAEKREVWLRGPVPGIPPLLQPVAHALLQAREELVEMMNDFPEEKLWDKPLGLASAGFHLQHLSGVLDRIFTYARAEKLTEQQLQYLSKEGQSEENTSSIPEMIERFNLQVDDALDQLWQTDETTLTDNRGVGRANLPSTVNGLLFHAAEHTMRHVGQLLVTVRMLKMN